VREASYPWMRRLAVSSILALVMGGGVLSRAESGQPSREAAGPRWTVHLFHVDRAAVARLNGEPVLIAGHGQSISGDITPSIKAGRNVLTLEFYAETSSHRGSYGYRIDVDGRAVLEAECGFPGKFGCPLVSFPIPGRPGMSGLAENSSVIHSATLRFLYYKVPGRIRIPQPSAPDTQWATAAAILLSWKEKRTISAREAARRAGARYAALPRAHAAIDRSDFDNWIHALGFVSGGVQQPGADAFIGALESCGPAWMVTPGRIAYAIGGDGTDERTYVSLVDLAAGVQRSESLAGIENPASSGIEFICASSRSNTH